VQLEGRCKLTYALLLPSHRQLACLSQELERTQAERSSDFSRLSRGVAEVQSLYAARCQEIWAGVADDFGAPAGGGGGSGGGR